MKNSFLFKELKKKSPDLAVLVKDCWDEAQKLLRHIPAIHRSYTSHGPDHALALLRILDIALEPIKLSLNGEELYMLISAILLHDIGMVGSVSANDFTRDRYRKEHHIRTYFYIVKNWKELHIKRDYRKIIATIAASHRKINIDEQIIERKIGVNASVPPRAKLCAALLRIADECHITEDRVPEDYGILDLPDESLKHFYSHFKTTGLSFDPNKGNIIFTVEVDTPELDTLFKAAREKIQNELDGIQKIFSRYKIPYKNIILDEDREFLIRYKLICQLLLNGIMYSADLVNELTKQGEKKEQITKYIALFSDAMPFEVVKEDKRKKYKLRYCKETFEIISKQFLFDRKNKDNPLIFIKSDLAQNILNNSYLEDITNKYVSLKTPKEVVFCIIRKSPSALRYVIRNCKELPHKKFTGIGGLLNSLKAELQNDFVTYPELLLEPGLLDDVFDSEREKEIWANLKVDQICQYHMAFDEKKLRSQWVLPNMWELKANPDCRTNTQNIKTTFTFDRTFDNPMHLMIAAYRMNLPCRFEATDDFNIKLTCDNKILVGKKQDSIVMMEMNPHGKNLPSANLLPARFSKTTGNKYVIEILDTPDDCDHNQDYPFLIRPQIIGKPTKGKKTVRGEFKMTFDVNWDVLDCYQAALMIRVREAKGIELRSKKTGSKIADLSFERHKIEKLFSHIGDKNFEKVILKLARVQHILQKILPFPTCGLQENICKLLLKCTLRTKKDAQSTWNKVKRLLSKEKKKYYSMIVAKTVHDGRTLSYRYLDFAYGIHFPNIKVEFSESKCENPQESLQKALNDPKQTIGLPAGDITLSPQAAIEYFKEHKIKYGDDKVVNPVDFKDIMATSPEEHNTRVTFKWLPEKDCIWYKITPFVLQLEKLTWERWIIESDHLSKMQKDVKRAFIATKEACRIAPTSHTALIAHGWSAFKVGRLEEAIETTKKCDNLSCNDSKSVSFINLGLYYLSYSLLDQDNKKKHQSEAQKWYGKAIDSLELLQEDSFQFVIQSAINDLLEYKGQLQNIANAYLDVFQGLNAENVSIEEAKIMCKNVKYDS